MKQGAQTHGWPGVQNWNSGAKMSTKRTGGHPGRATWVRKVQERHRQGVRRASPATTSATAGWRSQPAKGAKGSVDRTVTARAETAGKERGATRSGQSGNGPRTAKERTTSPSSRSEKEEAEGNETGDEIDRGSDIVTNTKDVRSTTNATYRTTKISPKVSVYPKLRSTDQRDEEDKRKMMTNKPGRSKLKSCLPNFVRCQLWTHGRNVRSYTRHQCDREAPQNQGLYPTSQKKKKCYERKLTKC